MEPLNTKHLYKSNAREKDSSKWLSEKDFNPITSGESHRRIEYAQIRVKDEPYITNSQV